MHAEIISIGDELLIGQVINSNQAFIAEQLNGIGIDVLRMTTVGDNETTILPSFQQALERHDLVLVTGGLGPTHDDITRSVVCNFFNTDLILDSVALENIKKRFALRGLELTKTNEEQALVPRDCTVIQNKFGTAPGYHFVRSGKHFIVMPGVPTEMKGMMEHFVVPYFTKNTSGLIIRHRTLKPPG